VSDIRDTANALPHQIDYFEDLPAQEAPEPATLARLTELAQESKQLEKDIQAATVALEELKGKNDKILMVKIPEIMATLGMEEFKLTDGSKITVKEDVKCGLSEERKPFAFDWLRENQFDGIIKQAVSLSFGKGENDAAKRAMTLLQEAGFEPNVGENIHPATLKSFVKEQLEAGTNIPLDVFGVYEYKIAKIALPRTRK
jgi:hypothetical protein